MTWTEAAHPRNAKGPAGGEFKGGNAAAKPVAKPAKKAPAKKAGAAPHGSMSFNGKTGTGYGSPHGDARVKRLQTMLNKLGLKDAHGKPLAVDGKLGPLTTQAVKRWQRKNGMPANGVVTSSMLSKATAGKHKTTTAAIRKRAASKAKPKAKAPKPKPPTGPGPY